MRKRRQTWVLAGALALFTAGSARGQGVTYYYTPSAPRYSKSAPTYVYRGGPTYNAPPRVYRYYAPTRMVQPATHTYYAPRTATYYQTGPAYQWPSTYYSWGSSPFQRYEAAISRGADPNWAAGRGNRLYKPWEY